MASRLNSAWLTRTAVAAAVFALPLFAVGTAQAAIAGANPSTTAGRPDIRSATTLSAQDVQVCFDKALSPSSDVLNAFPDIYLSGYRYTTELDPIGATLDNHNNQCIDLAFNTQNGSLDLGQFTEAVADAGAVTAASPSSGGLSNLDDATTLTSATTHNGTAGLTTGPDLVGPAPGTAGTQTIAFVFDQTVDSTPANVNGHGFWYEDTQGNFCFSTSAVASGTTVLATFPTALSGSCFSASATASVTNARRAGVLPDSVFSVVDGDLFTDETPNALDGTNMPGAANGGATNLSSLTGATLNSSGNSVNYTFDHPINAGAVDASDFFVTLSNGQTIQGNSATVGANSVVIDFSNLPLNNVNEYAVLASVDAFGAPATGGGTGSTFNDGNVSGSAENSPGAVAIGGNAGAFARGFTTGPDAYATQFTTSGGGSVLTVNFDQRVSSFSSTSDIRLLNSAGSDLGSPTSIVVPAFPSAGPQAITMDVDNAIMAQNPTQVQLTDCAFRTRLSGSDQCSTQQILAPTTSGAHIKSAKTHKAHKSHKAHKKHKSAKKHAHKR